MAVAERLPPLQGAVYSTFGLKLDDLAILWLELYVNFASRGKGEVGMYFCAEGYGEL
jgi:hypothetical protein